jgi:molybdopterin-containing oxidoreductase family membrane subunit
VVGSTFSDGQIAQYTPSMWEIGLGIGGVALALAMTVFAIKVLPFLPNSLADSVADPHYKPTQEAEG